MRTGGITSVGRSRLLVLLAAIAIVGPTLLSPAAGAVDVPAPTEVETTTPEPTGEAPAPDVPAEEGSAGAGNSTASPEGAEPASTEPVPDGAADEPDPAPLADQADVAPAPLAAGDATIRVRKAGDRLGLGQGQRASGVAGAVFEAYAKGSSTDQNIPSGPPQATCTTDANGVCDLKVDSTSRRYLVVEATPPPGYVVVQKIAMGGAFDSGTDRFYRWNVEVSRGGTTLVPKTRIENRDNQRWPNRPDPSGPLTADDYQWANVKANPVLPTDQCGLNVALLFDLSGSIGSNRSFIVDAGRDFVRQLSGTPTSIGVFTFSANAPKDGYEFPGPQSIADASGTAVVDGWIRNLPSAGGGTNWDEGLRRIANRGSGVYDLAIVITDGNPTAWAGDTGSTSNVDDYDVENAVHSANWIKRQGTRVIAIGVSGQNGGLTATNVALISGEKRGNPASPQLSDDYFLTTFGQLPGLLSSVALNGCGGTVNVQKRIAPTWTAAEAATQEPRWPFEVDPSQTWVAPGNGQTGPNGEPVSFKVTFDQGQLARDVTISEPANRDSTVLVKDGAKNARCFLQGQRPLPADRLVNDGGFGFTVKDVTDKEIISCTVVNSDARLQAVKYNDLNANGRRDSGELGLSGWTMFLDADGDSLKDDGERSVSTNVAGEALFDRLEAPKEYRVCEVLQSGWFNTDPGGGAVCKTQQVNLGDSPAGPVLFGNVAAGGFTVEKKVDDPSGTIPKDLKYTIKVSCTPEQQLGGQQFPKTLTLANGERARIGPLVNGTTCDITETNAQGATVSISQPTVTIPANDGATVTVTNTYPVGSRQVTKTVTLGTGLPDNLIPAGTKYPIEVRCTFPNTQGFPNAGQPIPGFNPFRTTVVSGTPGQPGPAVTFGPVPAGSQCAVTEPNSNGATEVDIQPQQPVTIPSGSTPVPVTIENIYNPAVIKIVKVVQGATLPPDTQFEARVQCTFNGQQVKDELVTFSVATPGIVSNIPEGSTCTVTETKTNGGVPTYDPPNQPFPVDKPAVEVTVTNTFGTRDLTVTKAIDDNNTGLVPDGTSFTVNVACTFNGTAVPGFPQTATLTKPGSLSRTFDDLPVGSQCTVTETSNAGASSTIISPQQPVTITSGQGPVTITVTNVFRTDDFDVTKVVDDPSGRVPANTQYTAELRCTYPNGWQASGPIPGFNPKTLTLTAGQTKSSGQLPVGAECAISETDKKGAVSNVSPGSVTVGQGTSPVTVTVTNTYPVGALELRKAVDDGGTSLIPIGTEYTLRVSCTYPTGFPASGPIPGFSPLDVRVPSGSRGNPGAAVTVGAGGLPTGNGGLPVGSQCTVSEPDRKGAASVTFSPSDTVTVTADAAKPAEVTARNTYPVGSGEVVKITAGALASKYAPAGSAFLIAITCTYPTGFPVSGPIPGFNPFTTQISAADPGQEGTPAPFGPVPLGSQCSVKETDDGGATFVDIQPSQPITITDAQTPVKVKVTNTFEAAGLTITKAVDGPGGALVPPDLTYTAQVTCTFDGPNGPETVFDREVDFGVGDTTVAPGPGAATGLPVGSICTVREVQTNGATAKVEPSGPFPLEGPEPVSVDVKVTNTFPAGQLRVSKLVSGPGAALVPPGTTFTIGVLCELNGSRLEGFPRDVTLTTPNQLSETLTGLPVGSVCSASETDTKGAISPPTFNPPGTEDFQSGKVTIVDRPTDPITITVINTFLKGSLTLEKVADKSSVSSVGETITYTFAATNNGPVSLTDVSITDPLKGLSPLSCTPPQPTTLAPTEKLTCTGTYQVTQADLDAGAVNNTATATGTPPVGPPLKPTATVSVPVALTPALTLEKVADKASVSTVGETITYTFTARNTGNQTLTAVSISDPLPGLSALSCTPGQPTTLAPTEKLTCTGTYQVTQADLDAGAVNNTATATGTPPVGPPLTPTDTVRVPATQTPALTLEKVADKASVSTVGETITYTFTATNTGNQTLTAVSISDPLPGLSALSCTPAQPTTLDPGAVLRCTGTYQVTQADLDAGGVFNTATATGAPPFGPRLTPRDTVGVPVAQTPALTLEKVADKASVSTVGETITYTFTARNTGNQTLTAVSISDPLPGLSPLDCTPAQPTSLDPGGVLTCTGTYQVTQADLDAGAVFNTATATAAPPVGPPLTPRDTVGVPVAKTPALTLEKVADKTSVSVLGETITYTFTARNTGNQTLTAVEISDPLPGLSPLDCKPAQPTTLAPTEQLECTATYKVTQTDLDAGAVFNTATATGTPPFGPPLKPTDTVGVPVARTPALALEKVADVTSVSKAGDPIRYTFTATNTGNQTLTGVEISDPLPGLSALSCTPPQPTTLAPTEQLECTATYKVTQADLDAGAVFNTATATGTPPVGPPLTPRDTVGVPVAQTPALTLEKVADKASVSTVGETITYTFTATNTGNLTLAGVGISDPLKDLSPLDCTPAQPTVLAPTQKLTCTATYKVTQADLDAGAVFNTATATGTPPFGPRLTPTDTVGVPVAKTPALTLEKVADKTSVSTVGETITYTFTATNTGNQTLTAVSISDPLKGLSPLSCTPAQPTTLAPTEQLVCTGTYQVTQSDLNAGAVDNSATATGTPPTGPPLVPTDTVTVPGVQTPALTLEKVADVTSVSKAGDPIRYTFTATNTGNVTLTDVGITDPLPGLSALVCTQPTMLDPGGVLTCTATYAVTQGDLTAGAVRNTATATGTPPTGPPLTPTDTVTVTAVPPTPALAATGSPPWVRPLVPTAMLMVLAGALLVLLGARRRAAAPIGVTLEGGRHRQKEKE